MKEVLQFIIVGGAVVRYHTRPGIKPDTDAHHSHGVALLCALLSPSVQGRTTASATLLMAALTHDLGEQKTGDVSAPAKRILGVRDQLAMAEKTELYRYELCYENLLTPEEKAILTLADSFDGMLYCCRERALGNKNVALIWRNYCKYVSEAVQGEPTRLVLRASVMFESIKEIYEEACSEQGPNFDIFRR